MEKTEINLDDIFLPSKSPVPSVISIQTSGAVHPQLSNHAVSYQHSANVTNFDRTSSVSTVVKKSQVVEHHNDNDYYHHYSENNNVSKNVYDPVVDELMDAVFSAVKIDPVNIAPPTPAARTHADYYDNYHDPHENQTKKSYEDHYDEQIDNAFRGIGDDVSIVASSAQSSRRSSNLPSHLTKQSSVGSHVSKSTVTVVSQKTKTPTVISRTSTQVSSHNPASSKKSVSQFSHAHSAPARKDRSMTVDSVTTAGYSRFGGFDLVDDQDNDLGVNINLNHDEVAYERAHHRHHHHHHHHHNHHGRSQQSSSPSHPLVASNKKSQGFNEMQENLQLELAKAALKSTQRKREELETEVERKKNEIRHICNEWIRNEEGKTSSNTSIKSVPRSNSQRGNSHHYGAQTHHQKSNSIGASAIPHSKHHHTQSHDSDYSVLEEKQKEINTSEEAVTISAIASEQLENGTEIGCVDGCKIVVPWHEEQKGYSKSKKIRRVIVGGYAPRSEEDRTVLFFGSVGSGKTSVINSMLNYLYDVKKENDFRFSLTSSTSQKTTDLVVYVINNSILPYSVTIIDTPGVPNIENSSFVSGLIEKWLQQELLSDGVARIDAISIVLNTNENVLGWPFILELAHVKKLFGNDLKTNVLPIITDSEVLPQPPAIRALTAANIGFFEYYKVNNQGFMPGCQEISKLQHKLFFTHGIATFERYFRDLQDSIHPLVAVLRGKEHHLHQHSHDYY